MPRYQQVCWRTQHLETMIEQMGEQIAQLASPKLAEKISAMARSNGALNVCLARRSPHAPRIGDTAPVVVGKMVALLHSHICSSDLAELVETTDPVARWEYGYAAISLGIRALGDQVVGNLLRVSGGVTERLLYTIWLVGLLAIGEFTEDCRTAVDAVRSVGTSASQLGSAYQAVVDLSKERLATIAQEVLAGCPLAGGTLPRPALWQNALAMAHYHRYCHQGRPKGFSELLRHAANGGKWSLPCRQNDELQPHAEVERFSTTHLSKQVLTTFGPLTFQFISDPLEILNLGNIFDTCLRWGGRSERMALGWATNANIRVMAARAEDGRILARQAIALATQGRIGITQFPLLPEGHGHLQTTFDAVVGDFAARSGLELLRGGRIQVQDTFAPAYKEPV